jgi:hypothetical protein
VTIGAPRPRARRGDVGGQTWGAARHVAEHEERRASRAVSARAPASMLGRVVVEVSAT